MTYSSAGFSRSWNRCAIVCTLLSSVPLSSTGTPCAASRRLPSLLVDPAQLYMVYVNCCNYAFSQVLLLPCPVHMLTFTLLIGCTALYVPPHSFADDRLLKN